MLSGSKNSATKRLRIGPKLSTFHFLTVTTVKKPSGRTGRAGIVLSLLEGVSFFTMRDNFQTDDQRQLKAQTEELAASNISSTDGVKSSSCVWSTTETKGLGVPVSITTSLIITGYNYVGFLPRLSGECARAISAGR